MIGATLHARRSEVAPLPPTLHTTKKSIGPIKFRIGRATQLPAKKIACVAGHFQKRSVTSRIIGIQPINHQGHSKYLSLAQREPDEAPERPPKGVGSLVNI